VFVYNLVAAVILLSPPMRRYVRKRPAREPCGSTDPPVIS
jgi:hypothetical protein